MVIDTSAVIAILLGEPETARLALAIDEAPIRLMSAASLLEAAMVIEARKGDEGSRALDLFIYRTGVEIVSVDRDQAEVARIAWRRYGKGRHPASLDYGDCFAYALAKVTGDRLLYKGEDFTLTDLA